MSRKLLFCAAVAIAAMLTSSDCLAQGRRPVGRLGQVLGLGWGHGNHWQSPMIRSSYYNPYSEHNTPKYIFKEQDAPKRYEMPSEYQNPQNQVDESAQPQANSFRYPASGQPPIYSTDLQFRDYQPHTPVIKRPVSYVDQIDQEFELPKAKRRINHNRFRRYQPNYPDF